MIDRLSPLTFVGYAWIAWGASWILAALWRDRAVKRPPTSSEVIYRLFSIGGGALMVGVAGRFLGGDEPRFSLQAPIAWLVASLAVAGFAFAWWARLHLGRMWSSSITRKADHQVISTGPYGLVRHPIYSGVSLAALASTVLRATPGAALGFVLLFVGFYIKARLEERFLRQELGSAYDAYSRRVAMLVPFATFGG